MKSIRNLLGTMVAGGALLAGAVGVAIGNAADDAAAPASSSFRA